MFCFLANVVCIYIYIFFYFGINGTPIIDFQFSLLAPISKRGIRTSLDDDGDDDDDDDDEWIMFQLCTDAKS